MIKTVFMVKACFTVIMVIILVAESFFLLTSHPNAPTRGEGEKAGCAALSRPTAGTRLCLAFVSTGREACATGSQFPATGQAAPGFGHQFPAVVYGEIEVPGYAQFRQGHVKRVQAMEAARQ
jgi:hypothetical protein